MQKSTKKLVKIIEDNDVLDRISRVPSYNDDPQAFQIGGNINFTKYKTDGTGVIGIKAGNLSFSSAETALIKSLGEALERLCLFTYRNSSIKREKYDSVKNIALNPLLFTDDKKAEDGIIGWMKGYNLEGKMVFLPAQMIYLNYKTASDEYKFKMSTSSTGAAGEFTHEAALLNGIYEVVERDAFMNMYLARIKSPRISIKDIKSKEIKKIVSDCEKYNLELFIFNVTNDLDIPVFLAILVDKTGLGPAVTTGAKADMNIENAILGAISEAFAARPWIRNAMLSDTLIDYTGDDLHILKRGLSWSSIDMIKHVSFLINQKEMVYKFISHKSTVKEDLKTVTKKINRKFRIYYADITLDFIRNGGYLVYKVLIPGLQPLYLHEELKDSIDKKRLAEVASFFKLNNFELNLVPHPFL